MGTFALTSRCSGLSSDTRPAAVQGTTTLKSIHRSGIIPLLDGAAQCMVRNASHMQGLEHHGCLPHTLDAVVLNLDTRRKVLGEGGMEASLTQAVREGMANLDKFQLRARVPSIPNQLGAQALNHMPRIT